MEGIGPSYTGAIGAGTTNDAPTVASGATHDKGPSIDEAANIGLGGGASAGTTNAAGATSIMGTIEVPRQPQGDERPSPLSAYR